MTLDLAQPEHREALLLAYTALAGPLPFARQLYLAEGLRRAPSEIHRDALRALSSPSDSAALVRALLEGLGFFALPVDEGVEIRYPAARVDFDDYTLDYIVWEFPHVRWSIQRMLDHAHVPALILCLLACTTREEALAALREATR